MSEHPVIARRPAARYMTKADHQEALRVAQIEFLDAEAAHNKAIHARGLAANRAKLAGLTWKEIALQYGDIAENSAQMIVRRYLKAVAKGLQFAAPTPRTRRRSA